MPIAPPPTTLFPVSVVPLSPGGEGRQRGREGEEKNRGKPLCILARLGSLDRAEVRIEDARQKETEGEEKKRDKKQK